MKIFLRISMLALLLLSAVDVHAAHCTIATTPVNFGLYDIFSSIPLDSTGTISMHCQNPDKKPLPVTLQLSAGSSGSVGQRKMSPATGGTALLYNLYADPARITVLGDGSGGSITLTNILSKALTWDVTVYGRIPARQNVVPGVYGDTLTATILW